MNKKLPKLNIKAYPQNAAKNFSYLKIIIFIIVSLGLSAALAWSAKGYTGTALTFSLFAFILIFLYALLNIWALIIKIRDK